MDQWEREFHIARIVSGQNYVRVDDTTLYVVAPTPEQRFVAAQVYRDARRDAELDGALTEQELLSIIIRQGIWGADNADQLEKLIKALEDLKVGLFENRLRSNAKRSIRTAIRKTRDELLRLENLRHGLDYVTIDGLAISAKYRYLIGATLRHVDGTPCLKEEADPLVDRVMETLALERLGEHDFRDLCRNDPWRSLWGAKNHAGRGMFNVAAVELTDEQRNLMLWSTIYDNIREYPDCPSDDIIADDDMLDGWMTLQRRRKESQAASQEAERIGNEKIRNADEQFIMVDSVEDAREVEKMNDPMASMTKAQRMNFLKGKGEVSEMAMPDTARKVAMKFNELEQLKIRQGK